MGQKDFYEDPVVDLRWREGKERLIAAAKALQKAAGSMFAHDMRCAREGKFSVYAYNRKAYEKTCPEEFAEFLAACKEEAPELAHYYSDEFRQHWRNKAKIRSTDAELREQSVDEPAWQLSLVLDDDRFWYKLYIEACRDRDEEAYQEWFQRNWLRNLRP